MDSLLKIGRRLFKSRLGDSEPLIVPDEQREPLTKLSGSEWESRGLGGESNTGGESEIRRTGANELTENGGEGGGPYEACPLKALWA